MTEEQRLKKNAYASTWMQHIKINDPGRYATMRALRKKKLATTHGKTVQVLAKSNWYITKQGRATTLFCAAKKNAHKRNLEFVLTKQWVLENLESGKCAVTGETFIYDIKHGPLLPSIDRKDNLKGYASDNCHIVTWKVNQMLCQFGVDELLRIADLIRKNQK